jgi:hypothetical protein
MSDSGEVARFLGYAFPDEAYFFARDQVEELIGEERATSDCH